MVKGYATAEGLRRPSKILVSKRSESKSAALAAEFPALVQVVENDQVVAGSDIVFVGLLPGVARELLPVMPFGGASCTKLIISMMAAVDIGELRTLCLGTNSDEKLNQLVVRTVPLPSVVRHKGPILCHPAHPTQLAILDIVGTPVACTEEAEMKPLVCLTGHISSFFELMRTSESFMTDNGVSATAARTFVSAFYSSMAENTEISLESLADMAEEAATPGGINEQGLAMLRETDHFRHQTQSLEQVYQRLLGKYNYVPK